MQIQYTHIMLYKCISNTFAPQIKCSNCATQLMYHNQKYHIHNLCIRLVVGQKFTPLQQEFTINNISQQQLSNVIILLRLHLIFGFTMYLAWYFCNHVLLMKLSCIQNFVPSKPSMRVYSLPVMWNVWCSIGW